MFAAIARFDIRFRWLIIVVWIAGVIAGTRLLPNLTTVTHSSSGQFLSSASPSVQAAQLAMPFQDPTSSRTAIIVATRASGQLDAADAAAIGRAEETTAQLRGVSQVSEGGRSQDGTTAEILVTVPGDVSSNNTAAANVVQAIRAGFSHASPPSGLSFHLTGPLAVTADSFTTETGGITRFTLLFVIVVLFIVYRAALAPLITLIPAALAVIVSGPVIAVIMSRAGIAVPPSSQPLLIVLLLGAGADYGLFLCFRFREELARGREPREALVAAVARVGQAITYSGLIVAAALLTLLVAPSAIYRGLGPALAIGILVMLAAALTLMPALLAVFGRAAFWPTMPKPEPQRAVLWGRVAEQVVRRPLVALAAGVVLFGALAAGLTGYRTTVEASGGAPTGTDSAVGAALLAAHFPKAPASDQLLLRFGSPVSDHPALLTQARAQLAADPVLQTVGGPRASPDGRTVLFPATLRAGPVGSKAAADAVPQAGAALAAVASATGAQASGVAGQDATAHDVLASSNTSLAVVVPVVLVVILVLLGLMLRSLVAPWYLALTVGLSYLSSLGFATIVFVHIGGADGLVFVLPLLMFVFSMALGEDYNVLVMSRIREEVQHAPLSAALTRAIGITGTTVTAAGTILAGAFVVLGLAGGSDQTEELGFSIAFSVLLDTFFVRTLLVPSIAMLLGRWNWWPARLSRQLPPAPPGVAA